MGKMRKAKRSGGFILVVVKMGNSHHVKRNIFCYWLDSNKSTGYEYTNLPDGNWDFVSLIKDLTKEKAKEILLWQIETIHEPEYDEYFDEEYWMNYMNHAYGFWYHEMSIKSLLEANNIDPSKNYAVLRKI